MSTCWRSVRRVLLLAALLGACFAARAAESDELVLVNRILSSKEIAVLGPYGHASLRSRSDPGRFFIASNVSAALVSAKDVYESDLDGQPVGASPAGLIPERFIHAEIYRARPDVMAIAVTGTPEVAAFSVSPVPLPRNARNVPVFDMRKSGGAQGLVNTPALGRALAQTLGKGDAALIFGQGGVVTSDTASDLVRGALSLRAAAEQRLFEAGLGGTLTNFSFTRDKAIPEAGGTNLGPSGSVPRIDRFTAFYNYLGARDLERIPASTPSPIPDSDQALVRDLVIANRLLVHPELGVLTPDGLAHISVRSRADPSHFFIARDLAPGMVTAADIIENDLDTRPVNGARVPQYSERYIHAEIYRARPDVMAVLHAHTPELKTFGLSSVKLLPVSNRVRSLGSDFPVFDIRKYTGGAPSPVSCPHCISTPELGRALAKTLGSAPVALLLDHGIAMGDSSLRALVVNAYNLRMNARIQRLAAGLGGEVGAFDTAAARDAAPSAFPEWDYWRQLLLGSTDLNAIPKPAVGLPVNVR